MQLDLVLDVLCPLSENTLKEHQIEHIRIVTHHWILFAGDPNRIYGLIPLSNLLRCSFMQLQFLHFCYVSQK